MENSLLTRENDTQQNDQIAERLTTRPDGPMRQK